MKFVKEILIVICIFISFVSNTNYGICSENVNSTSNVSQNVAIPAVENQSSSQNAAAPVQQTTQAPVQQVQQTQQPPQPPVDLQQNKATSTNQGFIPAFLKMLKSLLIVIVLIIAIAGIISMFKRMKSKYPDESAYKRETNEQEISEPANVSEAVSSFVRHKIKRSS